MIKALMFFGAVTYLAVTFNPAMLVPIYFSILVYGLIKIAWN